MTMSIDQVRRALGRGALRDRFEVFPDPSNNYWIVWDLDEDSVAGLGTQLLQHLSESKARAFCSRLNRPQSKRSLILARALAQIADQHQKLSLEMATIRGMRREIPREGQRRAKRWALRQPIRSAPRVTRWDCPLSELRLGSGRWRFWVISHEPFRSAADLAVVLNERPT